MSRVRAVVVRTERVTAWRFWDGDYYGKTVNVAARIAEYARPGDVLVSQEDVDASGEAEVAFREIGPVELKGVGGAVRLHAASRIG